MINEILILSSQSELVASTIKKIYDHSPIKGLAFSNCVDDQPEVKANQVAIFLSSDSKDSMQFITSQKLTQIAYATSTPDDSVVSSLGNHIIIGAQRHLTFLENSSLNLGVIRSNLSVCEPAIRECDGFLLDLNVLRNSELQGDSLAQPSGLFSEDVSQLCRYAGMNEKMKCLIINNTSSQNLDLIAQLIWYFAESASIRFPDHPYFTNTVEEYAVEVSSYDTTLSFYKSKSSGRWWVKIPDIEENKWKSCSYEDYTLACNDNISPELLDLISVV